MVTMALFGTGITSSKVVVGQLPHEVAATLRFGGGAVVLVLLLCLRRDSHRFSWRELGVAGTVGLIGVFAYNFFFFWGLSLAPAIDGSIIVPVLTPVLTTIAMLLAGRETASTLRIVGLVLGVGGAAVFFIGIGGGGGLTGGRLAGDFVYLIAAACWAGYSIASKKVLSGMEPLRATTYATCVGALALALIATPSLSKADWSAVRGSTWAKSSFSRSDRRQSRISSTTADSGLSVPSVPQSPCSRARIREHLLGAAPRRVLHRGPAHRRADHRRRRPARSHPNSLESCPIDRHLRLRHAATS